MNKEGIGTLFLTRICTTLALLVIIVVLVLELFLGLFYIAFYFVTGLETPMFNILKRVAEYLGGLKYVEDV